MPQIWKLSLFLEQTAQSFYKPQVVFRRSNGYSEVTVVKPNKSVTVSDEQALLSHLFLQHS